jgi:hypothetical protein
VRDAGSGRDRSPTPRRPLLSMPVRRRYYGCGHRPVEVTAPAVAGENPLTGVFVFLVNEA